MTIGDDGQYPGGKNLAGVHQWIIDRMPTHSVYAEPFVGSGAILRRKPPALHTYVLDLDEQIVDWWERLAWPGVRVMHGDGIVWLENAAEWADGDTLIYADPPYMLEARVKQKIYKHELTFEQHEQLLDALLQLRCRVMISGYHTALYETKLRDWHYETRRVTTRGSARIEYLWMNFDPQKEYSLLRPTLGANFRERERIGRKVRRWRERLKAMPEAERRNLLLELLEVSNTEACTDDNGERRRTHNQQKRLAFVQQTPWLQDEC